MNDTRPTEKGQAIGLAVESWFASVAALWEKRPERLADVIEQIRTIHAKLVEWGMEPSDRDELDHATIAFSRVVVSYECVQWLPFDLVPNWEDDLYCVLVDEDRWQEAREKGQCTSRLADELRALAVQSEPRPGGGSHAAISTKGNQMTHENGTTGGVGSTGGSLLRSSFAGDPLSMRLGRLRLVAGKTLPRIHVDDVVLYADIASALAYIAELEEQCDYIGLKKAQHAASANKTAEERPRERA